MTPQQAKTVTIIMGCIEPYLDSFKWRHMPMPNKKVERLGFELANAILAHQRPWPAGSEVGQQTRESKGRTAS